MKTRSHLLLMAIAAAILALLLIPVLAAGKDDVSPKPGGEKVTEQGRIDWDKGMLYATGLGAISNEEPNQAKAYLRARSFAKLDALRNLLMVVDHVRIDSQTLGSDFEAKSDEIRAEVRGIVRGAQIVAERQIRKGNGQMLEVTVATAMYGDQGIAGAFLPEVIRRNRAADQQRQGADNGAGGLDPGRATLPTAPPRLLSPETLLNPTLEPITPPRPDEPITSLIVETRGLKIERCMSPRLLRPDGSEVWGTLKVDPDWLIAHGIVVYAHSIAQARKNDRAGNNPLILRSVGRGGSKFNSDPVLSDIDAETLLRANAQDGFLNRFRVIFVIDPGL